LLSGSEIADWLKRHLLDTISLDEALGPCVAGFPPHVGSVWPVDLVAFHDIKIVDRRGLDDDSQLIRLRVTAEIEFSISVSREMYDRYLEVRDYVGPGEYFSDLAMRDVATLSIGLDAVVSGSPPVIESADVDSIFLPA
jgi:hypothetical protein